MQLVQNIKRKSIAHNTLVLLAAMTLSTAVATDALAAGRGGGGVGHGGGHIGRGFHAPLMGRVPSTRPIFNRSTPYTLPESPETPVSPASPGSVFGNG